MNILIGIRKYFRFEIFFGELIETVPNKQFKLLIKSILDFLRVGQGIASFHNVPRTSKSHISKVLNNSKLISDIISSNSNDPGLIHLLKELNNEVQTQLAQLNVVPSDINLSFDEEILKLVQDNLPSQPWPKDIHKRIAKNLNVSNSKVYLIIRQLIHRGEFKQQINGQLVQDESDVNNDSNLSVK